MDFKSLILSGTAVPSYGSEYQLIWADGRNIMAIIYFTGEEKPELKEMPTHPHEFEAEVEALNRASKEKMLAYTLYTYKES